MTDFGNFSMPPVPERPPVYSQQSYTTDGKPVQTETYPPQRNSLGANFSGLINNNVTVPRNDLPTSIVPATKRKTKKKTEVDEEGNIVVSNKGEVEKINSKEIVESTLYADTYAETNGLTYGVIQQADELLGDCKQELDYIRSQRNMKGKYHYMNATMASMSSLLSTKLQAIREINSNIKNANDAEYRRFKDLRAIENTDDNKFIMDAYTAFVSAPVGAPEYHQPGTMALTGGLDGIVRADYPSDVQRGMDAGLASYLNNLSPEESLMLVDNNSDIEEVLLYDEATGVKKFAWMNTKTGEMMPNLPPSSNLVVEDFVISPREKLAKNTNLNIIKKVVIQNEGAFNKY